MGDRVVAPRVPALAVIGGRDPLVRPERILAAAELLPHVTVVEVEGAPHAINFTHPEERSSVIAAFLRSAETTDERATPGVATVLLDERDP
jgi:pimeloyl-ACP methyl ester carboxylesterase